MHRGPSYGGRSKATTSTQCQKCLQRGHYSYECKVTAQERPYKARPSRTQQLFNPSLKPKLTTEVPNDLLRKKGIADEILAKKGLERGRKRSNDGDEPSQKRSRSYSSDSVSTISTNRSPSRSPSPPLHKNRSGPSRDGDGGAVRGKRARRSMSSDSYHHDPKRRSERRTRRRLSSFSPELRGRRGRSGSSQMHMSFEQDRRRHDSRSRSRSRGRRRTNMRRSKSGSAEHQPQRHRRHESGSRSPLRSRSRSSDRMDTSQDPNSHRRPLHSLSPVGRAQRKNSRSPRKINQNVSRSPMRIITTSPKAPIQRSVSRSPSPYRAQNGSSGSHHAIENHQRNAKNHARAVESPVARPRERSLSPYSKRVALTRQMHDGK